MSNEPSGAVGSSILFENDAVRVWEMTLAPGQASDFHQHHHDHLILYPTAGTMRARQRGDEGWPIVQDAEPGFVMYRTVGAADPLAVHQLMNVGSETVVHYIIEMLVGTATENPVSETNGRALLNRSDVVR